MLSDKCTADFCKHAFITLLIITFNGDDFHFCQSCTLQFNSPASEEEGRDTASSLDSFRLVIWLQRRDCGLMRQKWKIHVLLNTIVFVNVAVCVCMLLLMDCAFVCHLKWAATFLVSLRYFRDEFRKMGWVCGVVLMDGKGFLCVLIYDVILYQCGWNPKLYGLSGRFSVGSFSSPH